MRRRSRRMLAAFVVSVTSVALVAAGAFVASATVGSKPTIMAAAPEVPYTALTLDGRRGGWALTGTRAFDRTQGASNGEFLNFYGLNDGATGNDVWTVTMYPPDGKVWAVGTYSAGRDQRKPTEAYVSVGGEARGCGSDGGSLTVHEVQREGDNVSVFAATFFVGCSGSPDVLVGEVRWNSTVDWKAAVGDQGFVNFGTIVRGSQSAPRVVTFAGKGSLPVTFGSAALEGAAARNFRITSDTCSGATLAYDETCTVTLVARPTDAGALTAGLLIPDDTAGGYKYIALGVNDAAFPTPTTSPPTSPPSTPQLPANAGTFYPLPPTRIADTREGIGLPKEKMRGLHSRPLQVSGRGGVPEHGVSAVVLNVTVTGATAPSYVTVYPDALPTASSLNVVPGWTGANMVTVALGYEGRVMVYNHAGEVDVIVDVVGFYVESNNLAMALGNGSHYNPVVPQRLFDSREDWSGTRLKAGYSARVPIPVDQEWGPHITAVAVNVTAVDGRALGFLTTWDGLYDPPLASTLNYARGAVVPNMAVVPVSWCDECDGAWDGNGFPSIGVYTNVDTHVVVDIMGVYDDAVLGEGLRFAPMSPRRIVDTREGLGLAGALRAGQTRTVTVPGSIASVDTWGVALNVTAVDPTAYGFVSVWPKIGELARPLVSNLNTAPGQTLPNSVYTLIGPEYGFNVYNHDGRTHLVVDVVGTFYLAPEVAGFAGSPSRRAEAPERTLLQSPDLVANTLLQRSGRNGFAVG